VGLTVTSLNVLLVVWSVVQYPLRLGPLRFGGGSVPIYTRARREV